MLLPMQSSAAPAPSPTSRSFAGMLMDLAAPEGKFPPARDLDGLEDDVATLSYARALDLHGRPKPADPGSIPRLVPTQPASGAAEPALPSAAFPHASQMPAPDRRSASVTVRLCYAESERLRQRAAESGLTISEYLRSCVFEVESLRAQVKDTVAALRALHNQSASRSRHWWRRWLAHRGASRPSA